MVSRTNERKNKINKSINMEFSERQPTYIMEGNKLQPKGYVSRNMATQQIMNFSFPKVGNITSMRANSPINSVEKISSPFQTKEEMKRIMFGPKPQFSLSKVGSFKYQHVRMPKASFNNFMPNRTSINFSVSKSTKKSRLKEFINDKNNQNNKSKNSSELISFRNTQLHLNSIRESNNSLFRNELNLSDRDKPENGNVVIHIKDKTHNHEEDFKVSK
jgi:hypothetical protein